MAITSTGYKVGKQPLAQSFFVDEPRGIYCTRIDLFFREVDTSSPIQVQLRPMVNGFPSASAIIPGATKTLTGLTSSDTSTDATVATAFSFDEPVFLKGLTDFAVVIIADSKDFEVYVAEINKFVVGSTEKRVNKQPITGSLYYSQNGVTFTPSQNRDLTFKVHRAAFKHASGNAKFTNAKLPRRLLNNNPIKTVSGQQTVTVNHAHHGLQVGDTFRLSGVDSTGVGGIFASTLNKGHTVVARDFTGYTFTVDSAADSDAIGGGNLVQSDKNILFNLIYPNITTIEPRDTRIDAKIKTTTAKSYAGNETEFQKLSNFGSIKLNSNNVRKQLYLVAHDSEENKSLGAGVKSFEMDIGMKAFDSSVAPMIDMQRASITLVSNAIDKQAATTTDNHNVPLNFVDETNPNDGSSPSKHITRVVNLASEAVGIKIIVAANRPRNTDFQLYFRTSDADENIREKPYTLASQETVIPADQNINTFRDYTYLIGGQGGDLKPFTKFQVKIVFRSTNQAKVPRLKDLRMIALSV